MAKSGCIYGSTGTYKTTAIAHFARYIAKKTGKATLLLSADGGGWMPCEAEVRVGMIRPWRIEMSALLLPAIVKISRGFWPLNPEETDPSKINFSRIDWNEIGGIAVEGFTSIGNGLLLECARKGLKTGEDATSKFTMPLLVDGAVEQIMFAGNSRAHYQFVHNQIQGMTTGLTSLPCEYVLFTGLDKRTEEDDGSRKTIYGVSTPGKAITNLIPTWVGDFIHAQDFAVPRKVKVPPPGKSASQCKPDELVETEVVDVICRYYMKPHPDPDTNIMFKAKPRVTHGEVEALTKEFPGGYFEPTPDRGFDMYLETIDRLIEQGLVREDKSLDSWRERMDAKLGRTNKTVAISTATTKQ